MSTHWENKIIIISISTGRSISTALLSWKSMRLNPKKNRLLLQFGKPTRKSDRHPSMRLYIPERGQPLQRNLICIILTVKQKLVGCELGPVLSLCCSLLICWAIQSEATDVEVCQDVKTINNLCVLHSPGPAHVIVEIQDKENFNCYLYPTNLLNCSWTFLTLHQNAQLYVYISICDNHSTVHSFSLSSKEHYGSISIAPREYKKLYVIVKFNVSWHHKWVVYSYVFDAEMMEVLPAPGNISASVQDEGIVLKWDAPQGRANYNSRCFEYELDVELQEKNLINTKQVSYTLPNTDPLSTYRARIRARKLSSCLGSQSWSDWSNTIKIEHSFDTLNIMTILPIALGIPLIFLILLVLFRTQRFKQVLYPTIPRPPLKYKYFLEENNMLNRVGTNEFVHSTLKWETFVRVTRISTYELSPGTN
ncbi:granulocyte-macrophage colony-stimulating factor receptor subunit alpha-like isoform X2 [Stigmatopora nigra]